MGDDVDKAHGVMPWIPAHGRWYRQSVQAPTEGVEPGITLASSADTTFTLTQQAPTCDCPAARQQTDVHTSEAHAHLRMKSFASVDTAGLEGKATSRAFNMTCKEAQE